MARNVVRTLQMIDLLLSKERTIHELAEWFDVTTRTVRRDISALESTGLMEIKWRREAGAPLWVRAIKTEAH